MSRTAVGRQGLRSRAGEVCAAALSRLTVIVAIAIAIAVTVAVVEAEQIYTPPETSRPPRDARGGGRDDERMPRFPGTAIIRGHIVDAETGEPIARARVTLSGSQTPSATTSGTDGAFELRELPAGEYAVAAEKVTYDRGTYPDQYRTMRSKRLSLAAGQTIDSVVVVLYRRGALTGRLTDADDDPIENCQVQAFRVLPDGRLRQQTSAPVNDIGEFRLARMPEGTYLLLAQPPHGRDRALERLHRVGAQGNMEVVSADAGKDEVAPAGTFYPGVTEIQQARPVILRRGQSVTALDWSLVEVTQSIVSGRAVDTSGQPVRGGSVQVNVIVPGEVQGRGIFVTSASVDTDGRFSMRLQPGHYRLDLYSPGNRPSQPSGIASVLSNAADGERISSRYGRLDITVGGEPLIDVNLVVSSEATITGRVLFDSASPRRELPRHVGLFAASPAGAASDECRSFDAREGVKADGSFKIAMVLGTCVLQATPSFPWRLESVRHRGVDITDRTLDLTKETDLSGVEVVLTDRETALTFEVTDESGAPTMDYVVLVFPVDKAKRGYERYVENFTPPMPVLPPAPSSASSAPRSARAFRSASSFGLGTSGVAGGSVSSRGMRSSYQMDDDGSGTASLYGLPRGDYFLVALTDVADEDVREPAFLETVAPLATRVTLSDATLPTISLTRQTMPEPNR